MKLKTKKPSAPSQPVKEHFSVSIPHFPKIVRPQFADSLQFPAENMTKLPSSQIADYLAKYTELHAYANQELSAIKVRLLMNGTEDSVTRNKLLRERPNLNGIEKWRKEAVMDSDEEIEKLYTESQSLKVAQTQLEMLTVNYDRYIQTLSRELTRKLSERAMN